jgi:3-oxoacyl-[acyl-carrier-protein] synthase II
MSQREVVVTGAGLTTPLGANVEQNWLNLKSLKTGIGYYPKNDLPACFQHYGKVGPFQLPPPAAPHLAAQMKFLNRGALLGFAAVAEAVEQARPRLPAIAPDRRALYLASGDFTKVGYDFLYPATQEGTAAQGVDCEKLNQAALVKVNPFFLLESIANNLFSFLSAFYEFRGPNTSLASLSPYGSQALELAYRTIQEGRADVALAVGYGNWITEIPLLELKELGLISKCDSGASSFKPFDRSRDGFIPAEGAAALFLESAEMATQRAAVVLGAIKGCGNSIDILPGSSLGVPQKVCARSIRLAMEDAGCDAGDLAFISGHGSATIKGDRSELRSISEFLSAEREHVAVCGLKPYTGHMGAASDLAEIVLGVKSLEAGMIPATLNFAQTDREFSELRICDRHQPGGKNLFLSISYGLGGQSSCVVIGIH